MSLAFLHRHYRESFVSCDEDLSPQTKVPFEARLGVW